MPNMTRSTATQELRKVPTFTSSKDNGKVNTTPLSQKAEGKSIENRHIDYIIHNPNDILVPGMG
jgi:hypothetical protein